jgi:HPt (histidine-containing phosphotransfer) domain-containing protein
MAEGLVYVNFEEGVNRVMNNAKLYIRLLAKFKTDTNLDELLDFLNAGDYEKAQAAVHTIKGVAANLSLDELFKQTLELETQIKAHAASPGQIETVKTTFNETLKNIDKVIEQNG